MTIYEVRKIIYNRDGNKCYKCQSSKRLTFDHIKPKYKYHNHKIDNIITLCWDCNNDKFTKELLNEEFKTIQKYLSKVNEQFSTIEQEEMGKVITEYYESLPNKKRKNKAFKLTDEDWDRLATKDKNGKIQRWSIYRMRD